MSFFDTYKEVGGNFIGKAEKEELIASGDTFLVTKVTKSNGQWGEKNILTVQLDGEERLISFTTGSVESRDRMIDAIATYFEDGGEPFELKLVLKGKSQLLSNPNEDGE